MKLFVKLSWFFKKEWLKYLVAILLLIIISLLQLIPPYIVGIIIDKIEHCNITNDIFTYIFLIIFIALIIYVLRYFWRIILFGSAYKLAMELRNKLYKKLIQQIYNSCSTHNNGNLMTHFTTDIDSIVFAAGEGVLTLIDSLIISISVILMMIVKINWYLTLIAILPMLIILFFVKQYSKNLYKHFLDVQKNFSILNSQIRDNLNKISIIKSFNLENYQLNIFRKTILCINNKNMQVKKIDAYFDLIIYLIVAISNLLAIGIGSLLLKYNLITIGDLTSFIMYLGLMLWPILALGLMFNITEKGSAAYDRIYKILNKKVINKDGIISISKKIKILNIDIKKFYYPFSKKLSLTNIKIKLLPGQILGLCGLNGSGKSTLLSVILRNFDIFQGDIEFNKISIKKLLLSNLYKKIGFISQTPFLFSDSIANNIAFGKPYATIQQIKYVAKMACIHKDIIKFPQGYNTQIGEHGVFLSGGQRQQIIIARALILKTEILIIDDALSAIDNQTKHYVIQNLLSFNKNLILIISTHQLCFLYKAHEILVLNNGKIIQRGKHKQLIYQPGWYSNIYYNQRIEI